MTESDPTGGKALRAALYAIFRSIAGVCLRHGFPFDSVAEVAKRAFVDVARDDFGIPGRKPSASRVAVLTGLHRKDVARVLASSSPHDHEAEERITSSAAVIAGWRRDKKFADGRGLPAALGFDEGSPNFTDIVRRYAGGDVPPRAVLDELRRVDAVSELKDGRIRLTATGYVPTAASPEGLAILGSDVSDLVAAIDHNLTCDSGDGFFQRKVAYDNLPDENVDEVLQRIEREGQSALEKLDRVISKRDRDSNPKVQGTGRRRVMVGVYCYSDDVPEDETE